MFTIETNVEKSYNLSAEKQKLFDFFANPTNFAHYMSDIIHSVEVKTTDHSIWTIKIDISASSSITVKLEMVEKVTGQGLIKYSPKTESENHLGVIIKLTDQHSKTNVNFNLDLKLERKSSFDIHPLASLLGESAVNKIVNIQAQQHIDSFVGKAESQTQHKK